MVVTNNHTWMKYKEGKLTSDCAPCALVIPTLHIHEMCLTINCTFSLLESRQIKNPATYINKSYCMVRCYQSSSLFFLFLFIYLLLMLGMRCVWQLCIFLDSLWANLFLPSLESKFVVVDTNVTHDSSYLMWY